MYVKASKACVGADANLRACRHRYIRHNAVAVTSVTCDACERTVGDSIQIPRAFVMRAN